jgi:hypothetical protein
MATNLYNEQEYSIENIKEIYNKRWDIEEYFKYLKKTTKLKFINEKRFNKIKDSIYIMVFLSKYVYLIRSFYEKLYEDYFSAKSVKLAVRVIKNEPGLPPAFDNERDNDNFDEFVFDATKFTYQYMKDHKLYCEEMNDWIESTEQDWEPLKRSK